MHDMTRRYVQETPLVKIEDIQGVPDFIQKFIAASVAGSPPDVVWIRQTYIPGFAEKDMLLDLLPGELEQVGLRAEDFDPTVWRASEYRGKRYTVPIDIHGYQLIWNEAQVREGGGDPARAPVDLDGLAGVGHPADPEASATGRRSTSAPAACSGSTRASSSRPPSRPDWTPTW